ncbi:AAA domain-containing protein, partial [Mucidula mucida]
KKPKKTISTPETTTSAVEGVVYKVSDTRVVVAVDQSDSSSDLDLPERCRVLKIANSVTYDRMDKAIDTLESVVTGSKPNDKTIPKLTPLIHQKDAIKFCLEAPEVACIHGPPGTGKTHTLIEIIRQLTHSPAPDGKPRRLLVCGASNLSVDNILERLDPIGHPARVMAHEGVLDSTLEVKASRTDQAALAKDVRAELESTLNVLSGSGKGAKGKRPKGAERKKLWEDVKALRKEYRQREGGVVEAVLSESQVVLTTCHSAGGRQLRNHTFDVVIIDEATQALEPVCWVPIFKASKLILAGDPLQLPPTVLSLDKAKKEKKAKAPAPKAKKNAPKAKPQTEDASDSDDSASTEAEETEKPVVSAKSKSPSLIPPRTLETTIFDRLERMYGNKIKRMLTVQYRFDAFNDMSIPSKTLYHNKLESHNSVSEHLLSDIVESEDTDEEAIKEVLGTPVVFFDTAGCEYFERLEGDGDEGSRCNENEAMVVKSWVDKLTGMAFRGQIAIITPQVTLLTSLLRPQYGAALEIGTVDGMQGREKDAVIISLVRSNDKLSVRCVVDAILQLVAMTRAKRHLCVVGDSSTVRHGGRYLKNWLAWLDSNADVRYAGLD